MVLGQQHDRRDEREHHAGGGGHLLPRRAEAGEVIRCKPATKQTAATR